MKKATKTLEEDWNFLWRHGCKKITVDKIGVSFDHKILEIGHGIGFTMQWHLTELTGMSLNQSEFKTLQLLQKVN